MGYLYDQHNRLCCDSCGQSGGVRRCRCPYNYCPAAALCVECKKKFKERLGKQAHEQCRVAHEEMEKRDREAERILNSGGKLRCSALSIPQHGVHVLFRDSTGATTGFYMSSETYDAFPLGENVTPEMFQQHGQLSPAPSDFL